MGDATAEERRANLHAEACNRSIELAFCLCEMGGLSSELSAELMRQMLPDAAVVLSKRDDGCTECGVNGAVTLAQALMALARSVQLALVVDGR